jgi:hypothetical protein
MAFESGFLDCRDGIGTHKAFEGVENVGSLFEQECVDESITHRNGLARAKYFDPSRLGLPIWID